VTDSSSPTPQTATKALSLTVRPAVLAVSTVSLPAATVGQGYDATLTASGGTTPYAWSLSDSSLPEGLSLDGATGEITGTPSSSGTSDFTVEVTDSETPTPQTATKALSIDVTPVSPLYVSDVSPSNGPTAGGTSVTISGAGFVDVEAVKFGGVEAQSYTTSTSSQIVAVSPEESAGTVDVTVTTSAGASETNSADEFTFTVAEVHNAQCSAGTSCSDSVSTPLDDTTITVSGTATTSSSSVTIDLTVNADTLSCGTSYDYSTAVSTLSTSGFSSGVFLTVTEEVGDEPSVKGVKVCFEGSDQTTAAFLRPCKGAIHKACLQSLMEEDGGVFATFVVPANDPRFWAGGAPVDLKSFSPTHGVPGSTVTLKGKNLTGVVNVVIGGATATIDSVTSKKVVVSVPGNALTGTISVTAASGTATSVLPFTVT
jgi:Putative Ig domain/IPT/TIG domain